MTRKSMKFVAVLALLLMLLSLAACGNKNQSGYSDIDAEKAQQLIKDEQAFILDVREPDEYAQGHLPGSHLISYGQIPDSLNAIPKDKPVIVLCATGSRSAVVSDYLAQNGYTNIFNLKEGIMSWPYQIEK